MQSNTVFPNNAQPSKSSQVEKQARLTYISFDPVVNGFHSLGGNITADVQLPTSSSLRLLRPTLNGSRATGIFDASSSMYPSQYLVTKVSWPEVHRSNEATIINQAYVALNGLDVSKHLPKLLGWKDVYVSNTTEIVESLKQTGCSTNVPRHKRNPRILRLLLFRRLQPLDKMDYEDQFMQAWVDCFKCHYALWNKAIEHGDISVWNLMWDPVDKCGVLNDFDMAMIKGSTSNRGTELTGTLPFMSRLRILNASGVRERVYADDLESFIWVFAWLSLRGTDLKDTHTTWDWRTANTHNDVDLRRQRFMDRYQEIKSNHFSRAWKKGKLLLNLLCDVGKLQGLYELNHQTGEMYPNDIYLEVLKIMEDDSYEENDLRSDFNRDIQKRIFAAGDLFHQERKAAMAKAKKSRAPDI